MIYFTKVNLVRRPPLDGRIKYPHQGPPIVSWYRSSNQYTLMLYKSQFMFESIVVLLSSCEALCEQDLNRLDSTSSPFVSVRAAFYRNSRSRFPFPFPGFPVACGSSCLWFQMLITWGLPPILGLVYTVPTFYHPSCIVALRKAGAVKFWEGTTSDTVRGTDTVTWELV